MSLIALVLIVVLNWQQGDNKSVCQSTEQSQASVAILQTEHHEEATLTDSTQLYRICSSRPQRVVPSNGHKSERTYEPCNVLARRKIVAPLNILYDSRRRQETTPFCMSVSRKYYVIALRHLIC